MDIALNAHAECTDGRIGRVENLIINPVTENITYLVIKENDVGNTLRLVSEHLVKETSPDTIFFSIDKKKFRKMKSFIQEDYIPSNIMLYMEEKAGWYMGAPAAMFVEREAVPPGAVALHKGAVVDASDGRIGKVDELLVEKKSGRITHLILKEGHLWGKRAVSVPVSQIDRYEEKRVYLKINKKAVEGLPVIELRKRGK